MEIKPKTHKSIGIKNGSQEFVIETVNFKSGDDVLHIFFSKKYTIKRCINGHIIITNTRD